MLVTPLHNEHQQSVQEVRLVIRARFRRNWED